MIVNQLKPNEHIQEGKVAKKIKLLKIPLYGTLVLPQKLYAAQVWTREHRQALTNYSTCLEAASESIHKVQQVCC